MSDLDPSSTKCQELLIKVIFLTLLTKTLQNKKNNQKIKLPGTKLPEIKLDVTKTVLSVQV